MFDCKGLMQCLGSGDRLPWPPKIESGRIDPISNKNEAGRVTSDERMSYSSGEKSRMKDSAQRRLRGRLNHSEGVRMRQRASSLQ